MFQNARARGSTFGGFRVRVEKDGHEAHLGDGNSDEERGSLSALPEGSDRGDVDVVEARSASPL